MSALTALFRTLLEVSLSSAVVIAVLLALRPLLRRRYAPRWGYWAWLIVAARLVLPVNFALPTPPVTVPEPALSVHLPVAFYDLAPGLASALPQVGEDWLPPVAEELLSLPVATTLRMDGWSVAAAVWLVGVAVAAILLFVPHLRLLRALYRQRERVEDTAVLDRLAALGAELGVEPPALYRCPAVYSPMVAGLWRPMLLLPQSPPEGGGLDAALRHELTHLKRRDLWYKLLLVLARCVHWYNPLAHLLGAAAERDLERSCDAAVVAGRDAAFRAAYGHAVLDAAEAGLGGPLTTAFRGGKSALRERLAAILDSEGKRRGVAVLGLVLAGLVGFAACVSVAEQPTYTVGPCVFSVPGGWRGEATPWGYQFSEGGEDRLTVALTETRPQAFSGSTVTTPRNITLYTSTQEDGGRVYSLPTTLAQAAGFSFSSGVTQADLAAVLNALTLGEQYTENVDGTRAVSVWESTVYTWDLSGGGPRLEDSVAKMTWPANAVLSDPVWSPNGEQAFLTARGPQGASFTLARSAGQGMPPRFSRGDRWGSQWLFIHSGHFFDYQLSSAPGAEFLPTGWRADGLGIDFSYRWVDDTGTVQSGTARYDLTTENIQDVREDPPGVSFGAALKFQMTTLPGEGVTVSVILPVPDLPNLRLDQGPDPCFLYDGDTLLARLSLTPPAGGMETHRVLPVEGYPGQNLYFSWFGEKALGDYLAQRLLVFQESATGDDVVRTWHLATCAVSLRQRPGEMLRFVLERDGGETELLTLEYNMEHPYFQDLGARSFTNVLGQDGVALYHQSGSAYHDIDYYAVPQEGEPYLLATCYNTDEQVDLNGDGIKELMTNFNAVYGYVWVYALVDGQVQKADVNLAADRALGLLPGTSGLRYEGGGAGELRFRVWERGAESAPDKDLTLTYDALWPPRPPMDRAVTLTATPAEVAGSPQALAVQWANAGAETVTWGRSYALERWTDGTWDAIMPLDGDAYFTMEGILLRSGDQQAYSYDIAGLYGSLSPGRYRIATHYSVGWAETHVQYPVYAVFTIL